ncbi:DEAD/DEAH box helicase [Streptomyces sp. NPDC051310]|uniref:DEAD/DEAH box helicase n=1 Tax=Streptomyces sp. NPDC051310 TaxID=3365649 RepID=UPI0037B933AB
MCSSRPFRGRHLVNPVSRSGPPGPAVPRGPAAHGPGTPSLPPVAAFSDLDLPAPLLAALAAEGVTVPFPIQAATLPNTLAGRDVLGRGRTGSGKTLAFGLGVVARLAGRVAEPRRPLAVVLVPTRELAQQVGDALAPYARALRLRPLTVVGGLSLRRQAAALRDGADILVATPGRLGDLVERGDCCLDAVVVTVLDEVDRMTDLGFLPQITGLLDRVPATGQKLLFSATLDGAADILVRRYLNDPVVHAVDAPTGAVTTMEHHLLHVSDTGKTGATTRIAARDGRVIMFLDTRDAVDRLTRHLLDSGIHARALHSGRTQAQRTRTLAEFKEGRVPVLVATDVAARGLHVDDLDLVVNVDPPADHKAYLHRGGRTARAGGRGRVVTLVLPHQRRSVGALLARAGVTAQVTAVRPDGPELSRITGARTPAGAPVLTAVAAQPDGPAGDPTGRLHAGAGGGRPARPSLPAPHHPATGGAAA